MLHGEVLLWARPGAAAAADLSSMLTAHTLDLFSQRSLSAMLLPACSCADALGACAAVVPLEPLPQQSQARPSTATTCSLSGLYLLSFCSCMSCRFASVQHSEVLLWRQLEQLQQHMHVAEGNTYVTQVSLTSK